MATIVRQADDDEACNYVSLGFAGVTYSVTPAKFPSLPTMKLVLSPLFDIS